MPTEEALCEQFGVSRVKVRRALADLQADGLVQRRHGRGTYVRGEVRTALPSMDLGLLKSLEQVARETQVQVLAVRTEQPPAQMGSLLRLAPGEPAVHALRLRKSGDTPLMLSTRVCGSAESFRRSAPRQRIPIARRCCRPRSARR